MLAIMWPPQKKNQSSISPVRIDLSDRKLMKTMKQSFSVLKATTRLMIVLNHKQVQLVIKIERAEIFVDYQHNIDSSSSQTDIFYIKDEKLIRITTSELGNLKE